MVKNFSNASLQIVISNQGENKYNMNWIGQSDDRTPSTSLNPYLDSLIPALAGSQLVVEYTQLEYMNSSTVPPIIQFIKKLNSNETTTLIHYDASSKWQSASFKAIETLSRMMPHITVKGLK
ncbi:hypothetical protein QUF76_00760 [Desulfobacterales bacterium HSG16]|nr:hypothetical protein [Desulfobacterales bacterium HSG16]